MLYFKFFFRGPSNKESSLKGLDVIDSFSSDYLHPNSGTPKETESEKKADQSFMLKYIKTQVSILKF